MPAISCKSCSFTCKVPDCNQYSFPFCPMSENAPEAIPVPSPADIVVLLYYSYVAIDDIDSAIAWHANLCKHLGLKGRVRIAGEGVNVVLDGEQQPISLYQNAVTEDGRWGNRIQFKLSGLNPNKRVTEQRFPTLSVKSCAEVVSLGLSPELYPPTEGAIHLAPAQWHRTLAELERAPEKAGGTRNAVVLVDTRNVYESRIGQFQCQGVTTLAPPLRQFTDFPKFVDEGKTIMMYCTGGVRCERASAYLIKKLQEVEEAEKAEGISGYGSGSESNGGGLRSRVFQLEGGICSYLTERFGKSEGGQKEPEEQEEQEERKAAEAGDGIGSLGEEGGGGREGGREGGGSKSFFRGKNFVFDRRRHEPLHDGKILGNCHLCRRPHDDYDNGAECRCKDCRLLLLLCDACRADNEWPLSRNGCIQTLLCGHDRCLAAPLPKPSKPSHPNSIHGSSTTKSQASPSAQVA